MSELAEIICPDCDFRFTAVWGLYAMASCYERQVNHCPRCGCDELAYPEEAQEPPDEL